MSVSVPGQAPAPKFLIKYCEERLRSPDSGFFSSAAGAELPLNHAKSLWPPDALKTTFFPLTIFPEALAALGLFLLNDLVAPQKLFVQAYEVPGFLVKPTGANAGMGGGQDWVRSIIINSFSNACLPPLPFLCSHFLA